MRSSARKSRLPVLGLAFVIALLAAVSAAAAAEGELTRDEYVTRVDPICKANAKANARILKGVKGQVQHGGLVPAGKRFIRASSVFGRTTAKIARIPQPGSDTAKLAKWIRYLKKEESFLRRIGQLLKSNKKNPAYKEAVRLKSNNNRANSAIVGYGFQHCSIDQSKFL